MQRTVYAWGTIFAPKSPPSPSNPKNQILLRIFLSAQILASSNRFSSLNWVFRLVRCNSVSNGDGNAAQARGQQKYFSTQLEPFWMGPDRKWKFSIHHACTCTCTPHAQHVSARILPNRTICLGYFHLTRKHALLVAFVVASSLSTFLPLNVLVRVPGVERLVQCARGVICVREMRIIYGNHLDAV